MGESKEITANNAELEITSVEQQSEENVIEQMEIEIQSLPTEVLSNSNNPSFMALMQTTEALGHMNRLAEVLVKSQICPLKKPADVIVAIITGNQYNLPFMTSINNIFPINGKPTLSVHLQRAMLLKNKILFNKILDYEPIYEYAKADENGNPIIKTMPDNRQVPIIIGYYTKQDKPDKSVALRETDRVTKYEFKRMMEFGKGNYEKMIVTAEFKMSDASTAGLLTKDVWRNYPARMLDARAFAIGSREIASDITLGISTLGELADVYNIPYNMSSNFEESPIIR